MPATARKPATAAKPTDRSTTRKNTAKPAKPATAKPAKKPATAKPAAKKSASAKPTKKSASAKPTTAKPRVARLLTPREAAKLAERAERATAATRRIVGWLREHSDEDRHKNPPPGAKAATLAAYERALGIPLPPDLRAWWSMHDGGVALFEYEGLGCGHSMQRRAGMEELRQSGVLADHELFPQDVARIAATKWHPRWIPLAEDGCGNLYCVDMGPARMGIVGQVIRWEMRGGAFAASSVVLAELLERYADALESGDFTVNGGMFDGPYLDLTYPGPDSRPVRRR